LRRAAPLNEAIDATFTVSTSEMAGLALPSLTNAVSFSSAHNQNSFCRGNTARNVIETHEHKDFNQW
jgi:hypothetical protein